MKISILETNQLMMPIADLLSDRGLSYHIHRKAHPWTSSSLHGRRCQLQMHLYGDGAADAADQLKEEIGDMDFALSGCFVADTDVHVSKKEKPRMDAAELTIELLLLDE